MKAGLIEACLVVTRLGGMAGVLWTELLIYLSDGAVLAWDKECQVIDEVFVASGPIIRRALSRVCNVERSGLLADS